MTYEVDRSLQAPLVPVALYNGVVLNLFSNALKAITSGVDLERREIAIRAWNEGRWHTLQVSDTGIGVPEPLVERIFEPLFTTTTTVDNPLGSGMGLGLSLVRRSVDAFGGDVEVVEAPPKFSTCLQVRLPLDGRDA